MPLKQLFVEFYGDVIYRFGSICADEQKSNFAVTWRHVIHKLK